MVVYRTKINSMAGTLIPNATTLQIALLNLARAKQRFSGNSAGLLIVYPMIPSVIGSPQLIKIITEKLRQNYVAEKWI